jgi:hypothetical protein
VSACRRLPATCETWAVQIGGSRLRSERLRRPDLRKASGFPGGSACVRFSCKL